MDFNFLKHYDRLLLIVDVDEVAGLSVVRRKHYVKGMECALLSDVINVQGVWDNRKTLIWVGNLRKKGLSYLHSIFTWNITYFYVSLLFFQIKRDMYKGVVNM